MSGPNKDSVEGTVPHVERWLAAILSADVKGYSRLMGNNDVATVETLTAYREVLTQLVGEQRGRLVDAPGDELLAESPSRRGCRPVFRQYPGTARGAKRRRSR